MCMVRRLRGNDRTFGELADSASFAVHHEGPTNNRKYVVSEVYNEQSINMQGEREREGERERVDLQVMLNPKI